MNKSQKAVALGLALTTGLWLFAGVFAAPLASAATSADIQAQINQLMAEIQTLQSQLGTSSSSSSSSYNFTRNLTVGSKGADVGALQQILINGGYLTAVSAPTNYFGSATKAALAKWQAANKVSPASGYFGPLTRAALASASGSTTTTGGSTGTTVVVPAGSGLSVSVASTNPAAANVALGAVATPLLALNFTAGSQAQTVTSLTLQRSGLSQDADLQNVYLYSGSTRIATDQSISNGNIVFTNASGLFTVGAGQMQTITVEADIYNGSSSASHVMALSVPAASDVVTSSGVTVSGNFPVSGNQMTLVNVSNLATLTFTAVNPGASSTINAGQKNNLIGQFTLLAGNNPVKVTSARFTMTGSEPTQDIQNIYLMNGSAQVGAKLSSLNGNVAQFDLSAAPLMLAAGQTATLSLYADVTGGVGDYFEFTVQQASDIQAVDNMYNVGIGAQLTGGGAFSAQNLAYINVAAGGLVVTAAPQSSMYVVTNNTNAVLGQFSVLASGDSIRLQTLSIALSNASDTNVSVLINGTQLGTTQTAIATSASTTISSNLNYIIPANTTQTLTIQGTVASGSSVQATVYMTGQAQANYAGVSGYQTAPSLTILSSTSNLTVYQNGAFGTPVLTAGSNNQLASFTLQSGQVNPVILSGVTVAIPSGLSAGELSNLYVNVNGTQFGMTQGGVTSPNSYTFNSASPITINANSSAEVDVYATVNSSASQSTPGYLATLSSVNATAANNAITITSTNGQNVTISQGQTLASIALNTNSPATSTMGMGTSQNTLAIYQLNGSANGPTTVTQLTVMDASTTNSTTTANGSLTAFNTFSLVYNGNSLNVQPSLQSSGSATGTATFVFSSPIVVPQNGYATVSLVGNAANYNTSTSSEGTTHYFDVVSYVVQKSSGASTQQTGVSAYGNGITLYRTMPSAISAASVPAVSSASGVGNILAEFNTGAQAGGDVYIEGLVLAQSGSVVNATGTEISFQAYDTANSSASLGTFNLGSTSATSTATTTVYLGTLNGGSGPTSTTTTAGWDIPANSTHTIAFKVTSVPGATKSQTNSNGTYQITVSGVIWGDGTTGNLTTLPSTITLPVAGTLLTNLSN